MDIRVCPWFWRDAWESDPIEGAEVPLLSWCGSRKRVNFNNFYAKEKKTSEGK